MRSRAQDQWSAAAATRLQHLARQWRPADGTSAAVDAPQTSVLPDLGPAAGEGLPEGAAASGSWSRSAIRGLAVLVAVSVAFAGWWWWAGRPREAVAAPVILATGAPLAGVPSGPEGGATSTAGEVGPVATGAADAPSGEVVVHVVGQVRHPGLVTLPRGSRVDAAITAAGGVTRPRAADSVNLARVLVDGEQVVVGFAAQAVAGVLGVGPATAGGLLNLNSADATAFEGLPGVGPVLADRIVQWRVTNGPFRSVDELNEVTGIGDAIMGQLRPLVTV